MKYIITGYKGLIGSFLNKKLKEKHECIMEIDKQTDYNILGLSFYKRSADIVFHLASHCKINESIINPSLSIENNCMGTFEVLEFCRRNNIKKIVNFSSSRVLSKEENPYTASKKYTENLVRAYYECYGIEFITVRPSTVYAPFDDKTNRLLHKWFTKAIKKQPLEVYGDKNKTLDFTYITDFIDAIMLLIDNWETTKNKEYNIASGVETKLTDVAKLIISKFDIKLLFCEPETAQPQNVKVDITEIEKLGYKSKVSIEQGIKELAKFYCLTDNGEKHG